MGRYIGPVCRLCRREGIKLMLKGVRCETARCAMERSWRSKPPGVQRWRRRKGSNYGVRLREKQKVKRYYGIPEKQFMRYFRAAERSRQNTGDALLALLERRLDNVVWKAGFAPSRRAARSAIVHGHLRVNGRKVDRPSYQVQPDDVISCGARESSRRLVRANLGDGGPPVQQWLELRADQLEASIKALPTPEDVQIPVEVQLIIEMCTR